MRLFITILIASLSAFFPCYSLKAQAPASPSLIEANLQRCQWLDRIGERDSSLFLLKRSLSQAEKLNDARLTAEARMGLIRHFNRYQLRDSLEKNLDPLIAFSEKNGLVNIEVEAMLFKASHLVETQRYRPAMEVCDAAIEKARPLGDRRLEGLCLFYKGSVLRTSLNDTRPPLPYLYQAMEILEEIGDTANVIRAAMMIISGEQDEAKRTQLMQRAESLAGVYVNESTRMTLLNFKSASLPPEASIPLLRESLKISRKLRVPYMIQHLYFQLTQRYLGLRQHEMALACLDSALAAFPSHVPDDIDLYYYEIYRDNGSFEKAVAAMERYRHNEDERKLTQTKNLVAEWETKLNTREKEWELQQQQQELKDQRTRSWLLGVILLLTLVAGVSTFFAFRKQRKARRTLAIQNETIRQQSEELKSLEKLKSRFFANVSHELRTPLTLMLAPVHSLLKRRQENDDETKLLQFIQRNALQLQKLINEILDLSKLEDNKLEVTEEPVHFHAYLMEQMAQFQSAAMSNELDFQLDFQPEKSLQILLDKGKFEKIIHNFLSNAMKFTSGGGKITLTVKAVGDDLQLEVADSGRGIHPDDLSHVFDRFYQSRQPDAPTEGGTGIGLSLVKELAELLGGKVWAESEWGKGSVFYFRFPKKEVGSLQSSVLSPQSAVLSPQLVVGSPHSAVQHIGVGKKGVSETSSQVQQKQATILIVEDNPDLREYLQFLLSDYHVVTAENGKAALEVLQSSVRQSSVRSPQADSQRTDGLQPVDCGLKTEDCGLKTAGLKTEDCGLKTAGLKTEDCGLKTAGLPTVDLIISDLMMPVMDGFQFLEKLKADDRWRHLPVIMLTAKVNIRAKLDALRIGVDDYLTKPFQEEELKARIKNLLRNYRERMEMFSQNLPEPTENITPTKPVIAAVDAEWLAEVEDVFTKHLADSRLNVDFAANKLNLSERQFHRRIKQLTGLTPNQYLQEIRLQRAKDFLLAGSFSTVKEVVYAVGFSDVRYFSELFEKHFGAKPSGMRK